MFYFLRARASLREALSRRHGPGRAGGPAPGPLSQRKGGRAGRRLQCPVSPGRRRPRWQGAVPRARGRASTDRRPGQARGGSVPGSSWALPCPLIKGLATTSPQAVLWAKEAPSPWPEACPGTSSQQLQRVSSCVHKKNKCGVGHCWVWALV